MKKLTTIAALFVATSAHATYPVPIGVAQSVAESISSASSAAASNASQNMTSSPNANGTATSGNVSDSTTYKNLQLLLPNPLNVPQMTSSTAMCTLSESSGIAFGWNFFSQTSAKQTIDGLCIAERQAAAFEAQCKFRSAAIIRTGITKEVTKAFPSVFALLTDEQVTPWVNERDMSLEECNRPAKVEKEVVYVDRMVPVTVNVASPAVTAFPFTRQVKRRVPCEKNK